MRRGLLLCLFAVAAGTAPTPSDTSPPFLVGFKQPERWACAAWSHCGDGASFCDVSSELSSFPGSAALLVVPSSTTLRLAMATATADGTPCTTGGASFRVWLESAQRLLPGHAVDHWNGTYTLSVPLGRDAGTYALHVVLDFTRCEGSLLCSTRDTLRQRLAPVPSAPSVVVTDAPGAQLDAASAPSGRWIRERDKGALRWQASDPLLASAVAAGLDKQLLRRLLANRWVHLVGMSMTGVFRTSLLAALQAAGFRDARGSVFKDNAQDRARMFGAGVLRPSGAGRVCAEMVERSWHFFPSLGLLLTEETDANGHIWEWESYKRVGDGAVFDYAQHLGCVEATLAAGGAPPLPPALRAAGPDLLVYNHGIHSAHLLNSAASLPVLRRYQASHFQQFAKEAAPKGTTLVFRNSAPTHFSDNATLPAGWMCRTQSRLACINEMSYEALGEGWRVLDFWSLGQLRPDCTPDNRHYRASNCAAELCRVFLGSLGGWMGAVAAAREPYRANVTRALAEFGAALQAAAS